MANPYLTNSPHFGKAQPEHGAHFQPGKGSAATIPQGYEPQFESVEKSYYGPDAGPEHTGRMTYEDVIARTGGMLALVVASAAAAWFLVPPGLRMVALVGGLVVGLILGLVNAFKREPSPGLIMAYALAQGAFLGIISGVFEVLYPGIVVQAVLA